MLLKNGSTGDAVLHLQNGLTLLGYLCGKPDGKFGPKTEASVEAFQQSQNLYTDGQAGPLTLKAYNTAVAAIPGGQQWVIPLDPTPPTPQLPTTGPDRTWVSCPADKVPGSEGYKTLTLRDDVALQYKALYAQVKALGGAITTAGGKRGLAAEANVNRSKVSFHYVGRAYDLATDTGMINPLKDQYIVVLDTDPATKGRFFVVWCRSTMDPTALSAAAMGVGTEGGQVTLNACTATSHGPKYSPVTVTAFNYTKLAAKFGFSRIPARSGFFSGNPDAGSAGEWWHAQYIQGLIPGVSTFGNELLRVYPVSDAKKFVYWSDTKDIRYGQGWS